MPAFHVRIGLAIASVGLLACNGDGAELALQADVGQVDTLRTSLIVRLGAGAGDEGILARTYSGFRRGDHIYVANGAPAEVRQYDTAGRLVARIGRAGAGPGEFRHLTWVAALPGDSLMVLDARLSRVSIFGPAGTYLDAVTLPTTEYGGAQWIGTYRGRVVVGMGVRGDPRAMDIGGIVRDSLRFAFFRFVRSGEQVPERTSPSVGGMWWQRQNSPGGVRVQALESGPRALMALYDSTLLALASDEVHLLRWNGGAWDTIAIHDRRTMRSDSLPPGVRPARYAFMAAGRDAVWLGLSDVAVGRRAWSIHDFDGRVRAVLTLPGSFNVWQVGDGWVLGRRTDESGTEFVELLRVEGGR
ncbi:MAG: hypothetical protein KF689_11850 [Gemmatimonadaceae bacterium]|nr:hypothetical protein [Gemmatimonadaceae bacterium]MCW5827328.1 hypothetical protein [Gemmatimonadaceae bacterium]